MGKIVKMRTRSQYEDIVHDLICRMLPKFPPQDIKPAYQADRSYLGKNDISLSPADDGITGYTNIDNFMFFNIKFDSVLTQPFVDIDGSADLSRIIEVQCSVYGQSSNNVALLIYSLLMGYDAQAFMHSYGLHTYDELGWNIIQVNEEINGQFWERHDVIFKLTESIDLVVPYEPELGKEADITYIVDGEVSDAQPLLSE